MEEALEEIGAELGVEPRQIMQQIRSLPKAWEVEDLRAQIASLLKENGELKKQVADRDAKVKEAEALAAAAIEEKVRAEAEREKAATISRKFFNFVGFASDVVTKARLYDQCMKKPKIVPTPKILRMLMDFSGRVENLLGELRILLQYDGRGQEARPSKRRPEPISRPDAASPPASTPGAPATREPSAPTPQPEAPEDQPEPTAIPVVLDPTHQEPILDSLNTDDIPSLH